jgi:quaternary ammonium compound-resistance protein SugE
MNWLILIVAGLFEVVWAVALKMSNGFKNVTADVFFAVGMFLSVWLLSLAMRSIPMGTAYAVWTGIGAVGGFLIGIFVFREPASVLRIVSALLIVAGIVGLKLTAK